MKMEPAQPSRSPDNPYTAPASSSESLAPDTASGLREARLQRVVGDNYEIYRERWRLHAALPGRPRPWHWPAFLVPYYWLLFRKMYPMAAVALGCTMAIGFVAAFFRLPLGWLLFLTLLMNLGFGLAGNALYLRHCTRLIEQVERAYRGGEHRIMAELGRRGGISYPALAAGVAGMAMLRFVFLLR